MLAELPTRISTSPVSDIWATLFMIAVLGFIFWRVTPLKRK